MTKDQSRIIKGYAILLMLFLHLFSNPTITDTCHNLIFVAGQPLAYILTRAANPVAFFLIVGGYGLYKVWQKGDEHRWSRLAKLYLHYWFILAIFLTIGHFMHPGTYPGSVGKILANVTGYDASYCAEMWFLLPYVVLSACSPWIFAVLSKAKAIYLIIITLAIHIGTSFVISRYGQSWLFETRWLYDPLCVLHMLFNFCMGALCARHNVMERFARRISSLPQRNVALLGGGNYLSIS